MAKIDKVSELPEWFEIKNYTPCNEFNAAQWFYQLERRANLFNIHPDYISSEHRENEFVRDLTLSIWKSSIKNWATAIRQDPTGFPEKIETVSTPIRELTVMDLWMQYHADEIAQRSGKCDIKKHARWKCITDHKVPLKVWAKHKNDPIEIDNYTEETPPTPTIKVNMQASDSVLVEAFTNWLKETRKSQRFLASKREKPAYKDWAKYGLLPYIDLMTWAKESDNQITHHLMSEAVGYTKGGDSFRKTVPKLADDLLRNLSELEALASIEPAE